MKIVATQDEQCWFEDFVKEALATPPQPLPPSEQPFGGATIRWGEIEPGIFRLSAAGGSIDDRAIGQIIMREALLAQGLKQARYSLDWDDEGLRKEAKWQDIEEKAKRLIDSGKVRILRNGYNTVVGYVEGDHGNYQTEISRDDPQSRAISLWQCECPWDQFAWQRTRQWKKYEGRVCAHVLATYWLAQAMPFDEEREPEPSPLTPAPGVPGGMPAPTPGAGAQGFTPSMAPSQAAPGAEAPPTGQATPPELIPPWPNDPSMQPAVNPVSVPGLKPQTPLNPVQNAGNTFSSVLAAEGEEFTNGEMVSNNEEEVGIAVGLNAGESVTIRANSVGEVLGTDPTTGLVNVYFAGPMAARGPLEPHGVTAWFWPKDLRKRPDVNPPGPAIRRR